MKVYMMKAYLTVMNKIASIKDNEDGMETVQAIILIVVGIVIVGALIGVMTGDDGIVAKIGKKIGDFIEGNGESGSY